MHQKVARHYRGKSYCHRPWYNSGVDEDLNAQNYQSRRLAKVNSYTLKLWALERLPDRSFYLPEAEESIWQEMC